MQLKQLFSIIIKIGHAVECTQGGGVEGPGTCVTMWSFNPISGEDTTLRYCQQGELIKPESNIHSECTRDNSHVQDCFDVDERKKCASNDKVNELKLLLPC